MDDFHGINLTGRGLRGVKGDVGDVNPQMPIILEQAREARDEAEQAALAAAASAATAESAAGPTYPDTAAGLAATSDGEAFAVDNGDGTVTVWLNDGGVAVEQRTLATTDYLASTAGASAVGYKAPYTDSVSRNIGGKFPDVVSVTDFGTASDATTMFQKAMAAAQEYGRDLYIPKLDAGAKYLIGADITLPNMMRLTGGGSGSGSNRADSGTILEFDEATLDLTDGAGLTLSDFQVIRTGSTPGAAITCVGASQGFARNLFNNISVMGSNDIGVLMSGGWNFLWLNPSIRYCRLGLVIDRGAFVTGMNAINLIGGDIQANTEGGLIIDDCKQMNILGTTIQGNYGPGIGIGRAVSGLGIQAYFESNLGGHIAPYARGGSSGVVTGLTVSGATRFARGATASPTTPGPTVPGISLTNTRTATIGDGAVFSGYASNTVPVVQITEVGDSNRAVGHVGQVYIDAPEDQCVSISAIRYGKRREQNFSFNQAWADGVNSEPAIAPVLEALPTFRNPATFSSLYVLLNVTGPGDVVLSKRVYDRDGVIIGSVASSTHAVTAGLNRITLSSADSEDVGYLTVVRAGTSPSDTATGVTLHSITVLTHENRVKKV